MQVKLNAFSFTTVAYTGISYQATGTAGDNVLFLKNC
jgi:hypothetical protein